jgi:hypothetical protein
MNLRKCTNLELILKRIGKEICSQIDRYLQQVEKYFNHLLNVHGVHGDRQSDMYV